MVGGRDRAAGAVVAGVGVVIHHYDGRPVLAAKVATCVGALVLISWALIPDVMIAFGVSIPIAAIGSIISLGIASSGSVEVDRRGRVMPERYPSGHPDAGAFRRRGDR